MKKLIAYLMLLPFVVAACSTEMENVPEPGKGHLVIDTKVSTKVIPKNTRATPTTSFETYWVILTGPNGTPLEQVFPQGGRFENLERGTYDIVLKSHQSMPAPAFDLQYYEGTTSVTVRPGETTNAEMTLTQGNAGIFFSYHESVDDEYNIIPTVSHENGTLVYSGSDKESTGYFPAGEVELTLKDGDDVVLIEGEPSYKFTVAPRQLWKVTLLNEGVDTGGIKIIVEVEVIDEPNEELTITLSKKEEVEDPKIGDYYYSDGTWSDGGLISIEEHGFNPVWADPKPAPLAGKTVIGIVFQTSENRIAQTEKDAGFKAYAVAVKTAHKGGYPDNSIEWSNDTQFDCLEGFRTGTKWYNNVNGYYETMKVRETYGEDLARWMPAFDATLNNFSLPAPASSSGWFLPSTGQLWDMVANFCGHEVAVVLKGWQTNTYAVYSGYNAETVSYDVLEKFHQTLSMIPAENKDELQITSPGSKTAEMWTSTPYNSEATCLFVLGGSNGKIELWIEWYDYAVTARPIIAF